MVQLELHDTVKRRYCCYFDRYCDYDMITIISGDDHFCIIISLFSEKLLKIMLMSHLSGGGGSDQTVWRTRFVAQGISAALHYKAVFFWFFLSLI